MNAKEGAELEREIAGRKSLTPQQKSDIVARMCDKFPDAKFTVKKLTQILYDKYVPTLV